MCRAVLSEPPSTVCNKNTQSYASTVVNTFWTLFTRPFHCRKDNLVVKKVVKLKYTKKQKTFFISVNKTKDLNIEVSLRILIHLYHIAATFSRRFDWNQKNYQFQTLLFNLYQGWKQNKIKRTILTQLKNRNGNYILFKIFTFG